MRRKDREIENIVDIIAIIDKCEVCRLGLAHNNKPYVIPMNYGYEYTDDKLIVYLHCAKEGLKLDIIKENPLACFEVDCSHKLITGDEAWKYTMEYESVIGMGTISICTTKNEKIHGMNKIMEKYAKGQKFDFPEHVIESVVILRMDVSKLTGKRHIK